MIVLSGILLILNMFWNLFVKNKCPQDFLSIIMEKKHKINEANVLLSV